MLSYRFRLLALATAALAVLIVACSGGGSPANVAPTNTPDATSTPIPAGFLPIPTRTPWPTDDPGALDGPQGKCPPAPKEACPQPGETSNVYQDAAMNQVISLKAQFFGADQWVLEPSRVAAVLRTLDRDVVLEPMTMSRANSPDRKHFNLTLFWPDGFEPFPGAAVNGRISYRVDLDAGAMGNSVTELQWPIAPELGDLLFPYLSDVAPTPVPHPPTPTPVVSPEAIPFDHPANELIWDGPDDRVSSRFLAHCGFHSFSFDVPAVISVKDVGAFWGVSALQRQDSWRWTGYSYGDWQIWQGGDGRSIYLVHTEERDIAFKYQNYGCI